jgi:hypothetical protein
MKKVKYIIRILVVLAIVQIYACEKILDQLPGKPKHCRVKRIFFQGDFSGDHYGNVYYNKWGNPDSVTYSIVGLARGNQYFKYNHKQQMIQARYGYPGIIKEIWHKFVYTNGFITSDTVYTLASSEEPEPLHYVNKLIVHFEYDNYGRMSKEIRELIYPSHHIDTNYYNYDARGNRIYPETNVTYDNYTNIHVLHPIWQFLSRDYSLNNPINAESYNNFRLPTRFDRLEFFYNFIDERSIGKSAIEYDCK